jgi:DNA-directed RNA polymerase specialized sigma24 family protein
MPPVSRRPGTAAIDPAEEAVRLLAILLRLQVRSQGAAIVELDRVGFGPTRIATLLGTSTDTVNTDLRRAKQRAAGPDGH